ncbi:MAG TPA: DUF6141 family protein [Thermomicrobiales bacterium]|nr:DUF6141 family protein [Thermomicrobiales bacterium]
MPLYSETQYSRQSWLALIIALLALLGWGLFVQQIVRDKPVGSDPMPDLGVWIIALLLGVVLPLFFLWFRMETTVYPDRVEIRMVPFVHRRFRPDEIAGAAARSYQPLREYGGWGVRWGLRGFRSNRAYNVKGDQGVQLMLTNGDRVLIGTQRPQELEAAIRSILPN